MSEHDTDFIAELSLALAHEGVDLEEFVRIVAVVATPPSDH